MREKFSGYYRPTEEEFAEVWRQTDFAFDANVLLNTYRYTKSTKERFFDILRRLRDRIWLPHQAAQEYHKDRLGVISQQFKAYDVIESLLNKTLQDLEGQLRVYQAHPLVDIAQLTQIIRENIDRAKVALQEAKAQHPDLLAADDLRETITELFADRVGDPYTEQRIQEIHKVAESRFRQQIPPGYKDTSKGPPQQYGDVVLWFQLIDYATSARRPLIFVTDDRKEDWWLRHEGKTIGPRPELRQELLARAGVPFYMYQSDTFLDQAQKFLELQEQEAAVEEIRKIRTEDEALEKRRRERFERLLRQITEAGVQIPTDVSSGAALASSSVISNMLARQKPPGFGLAAEIAKHLLQRETATDLFQSFLANAYLRNLIEGSKQTPTPEDKHPTTAEGGSDEAGDAEDAAGSSEGE